MKKKYIDKDYPFIDEEEMDKDGFTDYYDLEYQNNTEFMESNQTFPPKGSFINIPNNEFTMPGVDVEETVKALKKLKEYENKDKMK